MSNNPTGDAVGVEIFAPDALEIMQSLVGAMELDRNNDCTFEYILPACARISKALGETVVLKAC
jgi:hypothetical protein